MSVESWRESSYPQSGPPSHARRLQHTPSPPQHQPPSPLLHQASSTATSTSGRDGRRMLLCELMGQSHQVQQQQQFPVAVVAARAPFAPSEERIRELTRSEESAMAAAQEASSIPSTCMSSPHYHRRQQHQSRHNRYEGEIQSQASTDTIDVDVSRASSDGNNDDEGDKDYDDSRDAYYHYEGEEVSRRRDAYQRTSCGSPVRDESQRTAEFRGDDCNYEYDSDAIIAAVSTGQLGGRSYPHQETPHSHSRSLSSLSSWRHRENGEGREMAHQNLAQPSVYSEGSCGDSGRGSRLAVCRGGSSLHKDGDNSSLYSGEQFLLDQQHRQQMAYRPMDSQIRNNGSTSRGYKGSVDSVRGESPLATTVPSGHCQLIRQESETRRDLHTSADGSLAGTEMPLCNGVDGAAASPVSDITKDYTDRDQPNHAVEENHESVDQLVSDDAPALVSYFSVSLDDDDRHFSVEEGNTTGAPVLVSAWREADSKGRWNSGSSTSISPASTQALQEQRGTVRETADLYRSMEGQRGQQQVRNYDARQGGGYTSSVPMPSVYYQRPPPVPQYQRRYSGDSNASATDGGRLHAWTRSYPIHQQREQQWIYEDAAARAEIKRREAFRCFLDATIPIHTSPRSQNSEIYNKASARTTHTSATDDYDDRLRQQDPTLTGVFAERAREQIVWELCQAVRPYARDLLLTLMLLAEETYDVASASSGRGTSSSSMVPGSVLPLSMCTEAVNLVLEKHGVYSVRATQGLCARVLRVEDVFKGDGAPSVEYAVFVSRMLDGASARA